MEDRLETDLEEKVLNYITLLEKTNDELLYTLKHCSRILTDLRTFVHDPVEWQKMLDALDETIENGEKVATQHPLH